MSPQITFDEAVEKACRLISDHKAANADPHWQDSTDDHSVLKSILREKGHWHLREKRDLLFEASETDRAYYDMLRYAIAEKIELSLELEPDEAAWTAKALAGEHDIPEYRSRPYTVDKDVRPLGLHALVVKCVHTLRQRGLKHKDACQAVAEACAKHQLDIRSSETVSDVWKRRKPSLYQKALKKEGT